VRVNQSTGVSNSRKVSIENDYVAIHFVAIANTALNEKEGAFAALEKDFTQFRCLSFRYTIFS